MLKGSLLKTVALLTIVLFLWACAAVDYKGYRQNEQKKDNFEGQITQEAGNGDLISDSLMVDGSKTRPGKTGESVPVYQVRARKNQDVEKKKKRFPWLFMAGSAVAAGVLVYFLAQKKFSSEHDDWRYTGAVDPSYDTGVLGIDWVEIAAGEFLMGNNFNEGPSQNHPVHAVYLDRYSISKYEVTFDQYEKFCEDRGWQVPYDMGWGRGNMPVIFVNWQDAKDFCDWLSQKTGKNIHLPTEAQWEKAARSTDQRRYPWGNADLDCSLLNYNPCNDKNMPVGSYPGGVSPYGVFDMAGNVAEWCQDYFSTTYYEKSPYHNPQGPATGGWRVMRGGSRGVGDDVHLAWIQSFARTGNAYFRVFSDVGFRIVME